MYQNTKAIVGNKKNKPPARTLDAREKEVVALAVDLAEQQLKNGTASPSVITHYLKLGTTSYQLELKKLKHENELLQAKTENLKSLTKMEELYQEAIDALRRYQGSDE